MRTIANLSGVEFLRAINRTRHSVGELMTVTDLMRIWKKMPTFTGNETPEERHKMARKQLFKNLSEILDELLDTHAEETYKCIMAMCILDEGEPEPDGIALGMAAFSLIGDKRVLDFLLQLGKSGLIAMDA